MKIVFRKWIPEESSHQEENSFLKSNDLLEALISTLQTINTDLDEHLNKENENNENN
jgi:hypothetical protein